MRKRSQSRSRSRFGVDIENGEIVKTDDIAITAQCIRVPVSDGHTAAVFMSFKDGVKKPSVEEIIKIWESYKGRAQELELPSAPKQFLHYFTEPDRPQIKSERNLENGMAVSVADSEKTHSMITSLFVCHTTH